MMNSLLVSSAWARVLPPPQLSTFIAAVFASLSLAGGWTQCKTECVWNPFRGRRVNGENAIKKYVKLQPLEMNTGETGSKSREKMFWTLDENEMNYTSRSSNFCSTLTNRRHTTMLSRENVVMSRCCCCFFVVFNSRANDIHRLCFSATQDVPKMFSSRTSVNFCADELELVLGNWSCNEHINFSKEEKRRQLERKLHASPPPLQFTAPHNKIDFSS